MAIRVPWALRLGVPAVVLAVALWRSTAPVCDHCIVTGLRLPLAGEGHVRARLFRPEGAAGAATTATVIGVHGYLADLAFLEYPWAREVTAAGAALLLVESPGHGLSGGAAWPGSTVAAPAAAEVEAALRYLRRQGWSDPRRVALLGHSEGAGAVLLAAGRDWSVASTVAISPSSGPVEYVNHIAPANLLLVLGAEDTYVLDDTDSRLISAATRGYLSGEGFYGAVENGSARRLVRVPGHGHVSVAWSAATRREVMAWLGDTLGLGGSDHTAAGSPLGWQIAGLIAAVALLAQALRLWAPTPSPHERFSWRAARLAAIVTGAWTAGLFLGPHLVSLLPPLPTAQGRVVGGLLLGPAVALGVTLLAPLWGWRRRRSETPASPRAGGRDVLLGIALALTCAAVLRALLLHTHSLSLGRTRLALFAGTTVPAMLTFVLLSRALHGRGAVTSCWWQAVTLLLLALVTAAAGGALYQRTDVIPVYLLCLCLGLYAAVAPATDRPAPLAAPVFAATTYAWLTAAIAALHR